MTEPKPLTPEEEADLRLYLGSMTLDVRGAYVPDLLATLDAERARPGAALLEALTEELYGLASPDIDEPGEVMVRIEEAVAAINSRWSIETAALATPPEPEP